LLGCVDAAILDERVLHRHVGLAHAHHQFLECRRVELRSQLLVFREELRAQHEVTEHDLVVLLFQLSKGGLRWRSLLLLREDGFLALRVAGLRCRRLRSNSRDRWH
jgi:hypothetical protein